MLGRTPRMLDVDGEIHSLPELFREFVPGGSTDTDQYRRFASRITYWMSKRLNNKFSRKEIDNLLEAGAYSTSSNQNRGSYRKTMLKVNGKMTPQMDVYSEYSHINPEVSIHAFRVRVRKYIAKHGNDFNDKTLEEILSKPVMKKAARKNTEPRSDSPAINTAVLWKVPA